MAEIPEPADDQKTKLPAYLRDLYPTSVAQPKYAQQKRSDQEAPHAKGLPNIQKV